MFRGESHKPLSVPSFMTSQMLGASALAEDTTSLNEVFKNDPVLSDILHHGEDSRPDSRCWGSVNSILNPKSSLDTEIPNSKPSVFPAFGPAQKITETSPASSAGSGNVPLYLRRAGMASSSDEISESKLNSKQDDPFSSRLSRQDPVRVGTPVFGPPQIPMFQRQTSSDPFTGSKPPINNDPFAGSTSFNGSSSTTLSAITPIPSENKSGKPQLTYANVLRNPQLLRESSDPLTRIRNIGTQGNRETADRESNSQQKLFSYFGGGQW